MSCQSSSPRALISTNPRDKSITTLTLLLSELFSENSWKGLSELFSENSSNHSVVEWRADSSNGCGQSTLLYSLLLAPSLGKGKQT